MNSFELIEQEIKRRNRDIKDLAEREKKMNRLDKIDIRR